MALDREIKFETVRIRCRTLIFFPSIFSKIYNVIFLFYRTNILVDFTGIAFQKPERMQINNILNASLGCIALKYIQPM